MSFDILLKQVRAISAVTGHMGGQVGAAISTASVGQLQAPFLGAQAMVSDALRLLALVQDLPAVDSYDYDLQLGVETYSNSMSWTSIWLSRDRIESEIERLEVIGKEMNEALEGLRFQIGQVLAIREQLSSLGSALRTESSAIDHARDVLDAQVIPALFSLRDTMESLLSTYDEELRDRDFFLWHINTVFKFVLPPPKKDSKTEDVDQDENEETESSTESPLQKNDEQRDDEERS